MITPEEIQNKEFARVVRGYKEDEVDAFLDLLTVDFDKIVLENMALKETVKLLESEIERYKGSESTILETLESAKLLMSDISASAEKRAEILLKSAELDAENIRREARESVERMTEESAEMARRLLQFRLRFQNLLQNEIDRIDTLSSDMLIESESSQMSPEPVREARAVDSDIRNRTIKTVKTRL